MSEYPEYDRYWQRKRLIDSGVPDFPVRRWWDAASLCDSEQICFDAIKSAANLLDVGAGDLRLKRKFQAAGYSGVYDTQDIGGEYEHTYADLTEVNNSYGAILCFDLIEHMSLRDGLRLLDTLIGLLADDGVLMLQTPNARCVRSPLSTDMTHLHCYNLTDLWAHLTSLGLKVDGYRVAFRGPSESFLERLRFLAGAFITTRLLGSDYADNILLIARKNGT